VSFDETIEITVDTRLGIGETVSLGSHVFAADEIKEFAGKYDPQPFHLSEEAAAKSVFGRLCASGWHTISAWMTYNAPTLKQAEERAAALGGPIEYGPAAGLRELKWLKPVYVGDKISYFRVPLSYRGLASKPGWVMLTSRNWAENQRGEMVMEFLSLVLVRADG
jgi:acyl dehydratase